MPYPTKPTKDTNFTALEAAAGDGRFPGVEMDIEIQNAITSVGSIVDFISLFVSADASLHPQIIRRENLDNSISPSFDKPSVWVEGTPYAPPQTIFRGGKFFICALAHTSATFSDDLDADRWLLISDFAEGLILAVNNLSDLTDIPLARENLGLGDAALLNVGAGPDEIRNNGQADQHFLRSSENLSDVDDVEAAKLALGLTGAALTGNIADLVSEGPSLVGRATPGPGPSEFVRVLEPLSLRVNSDGQSELFAIKATLAEIEAEADVDRYVSPGILGDAVSAQIARLSGPALYGQSGPMYFRLDRSARVRHVTADNSDGPSITSGGWRTRPLNRASNRGLLGFQVSGNRIYVPAGFYNLHCVTTSYGVVQSQIRLQRVARLGDDDIYITDDETMLVSRSDKVHSLEGGVDLTLSCPSTLYGQFYTPYDGMFEVQQITDRTGLTGVGLPNGEESVFLDLTITRAGDAGEVGPATEEMNV
jgi:hypothetical protein